VDVGLGAGAGLVGEAVGDVDGSDAGGLVVVVLDPQAYARTATAASDAPISAARYLMCLMALGRSPPLRGSTTASPYAEPLSSGDYPAKTKGVISCELR
jgi:hypothetical protein